jgi:hypothetical protein
MGGSLGRSDMTPEEREAAARPTEAGDYWSKWNTFRAAQRLFSDEVARIDSACRDKKDKKDLGKRTVAIQDWFGKLPQSQREEAANAAEKWNTEGASNKAKMNMRVSFVVFEGIY